MPPCLSIANTEGNLWVMGEYEHHVLCLEKATINVKKTLRSSQSATERVQQLRCKYWELVKDIEPENLVFLDETGVELRLTRTHARSAQGIIGSPAQKVGVFLCGDCCYSIC
jgi:hypothetical protein